MTGKVHPNILAQLSGEFPADAYLIKVEDQFPALFAGRGRFVYTFRRLEVAKACAEKSFRRASIINLQEDQIRGVLKPMMKIDGYVLIGADGKEEMRRYLR